jgi:hypothetical protein
MSEIVSRNKNIVRLPISKHQLHVYLKLVAGQEHSSIQVAIIAAFFVLKNQVLVPS